MSTCVYPGCSRTTYENNDKCIFHYEKDDWFIEDKHGDRDWSASQDKIKEFWEKIRDEKMATNDYDFSGFIFPEFEEYNSKHIKECTSPGLTDTPKG